jgi:hypothetical protein
LIPSSAANVSASLSADLGNTSVGRAFCISFGKKVYLALWKGNFTSVLHRFPYSAINFTVFEKSRDLVIDQFGYADSSLVRFGCGAVAGTVACVCCYPLDLLRTRLSIFEVITLRVHLHSVHQ